MNYFSNLSRLHWNKTHFQWTKRILFISKTTRESSTIQAITSKIHT
eukprot:UN13044